ncbi:MAG: phosphate ABC transporter permease subunit PstC [Spirochaetes bacterium GWD1_27_9]|nr:MAG: phosphate ABC transporter permease subunit PstC [Spirochaetes bacterium GWB1_27_13]OHD21525.1 MAG: phosphate ABC transporter permease subunit PstC [Spirochaetes bacterium GWC1_27_15]OHD44852.1 MAG: phosphate ABC transporter permease subunit PstC [Spirochaetes bacterium GWD1_27_9]
MLHKKNWKLKEKIFKIVLLFAGVTILLIIGGIILSLLFSSIPSLKKFGFSFIIGNEWDPVNEKYGALPFLIGTAMTGFLALLISLPFSFSISILLGEYFKKGLLSSFIKTMTELLAGIPSVIYGFWGLFFVVPIIRNVEMIFGAIPYGVGILTASIVLGIMIIPYSASIGREVLELVPNDLKEAAYSLGATRYEVIKTVSIPYSISGIIAGIILSLGRALGETMAVTMLIGNMNSIPENIFAPGQTIASIIANQFNEANNELHISAMIELGLLLLVMSAIINFLGKYIIKKLSVEG